MRHVELGEATIIVDVPEARKRLSPSDQDRHELKLFIETATRVENQRAIGHWLTKVSDWISHALHLATVIINAEAALDDVAELGIEV